MVKNYEFPTSKKLGDLKLEASIKETVIIKPKMYLTDEVAKCKGLGRMNREEFYKTIDEKRRKVRRFTKFKESNKRGLSYNTIIEFYKYLNLEDNKRIWDNPFSMELQDSNPLKIGV